MSELWDIYDKNRKKTGKLAERGVTVFEEDDYHIVVNAVILNDKNEILITKRAPFKTFPGMWECNGGSILAGETSLEGIIREVKEEVGISFTKREALYLKETVRKGRMSDFKDTWLFQRDIKDEEITLPDGEAVDYKWVTIDKFEEMFEKNEIVPVIGFDRKDYEKALSLKKRESYNYINKTVKAKIDRKINTKHPKFNYIYKLNYGYIPGTMSADGEELDCYVLGVEEPIDEFEGRCIAVIYRTNDDDDKLILVPEGMKFTDEEIRKLTYFQEKYFESEIIR